MSSFLKVDLYQTTLILKLDLDINKVYLYTEKEVPIYSSSKDIPSTDDTHRHIGKQTERQTDRSD